MARGREQAYFDEKHSPPAAGGAGAGGDLGSPYGISPLPPIPAGGGGGGGGVEVDLARQDGLPRRRPDCYWIIIGLLLDYY